MKRFEDKGASAPSISREEENGIGPELIKDLFSYKDGKLIRLCFPGKASGGFEGRSDWGKTGDGYPQLYIMGKAYAVHRLIWIMHNGFIPKGMCIDHINGDKSDNRLENLRMLTYRGNSMNMAVHRDNGKNAGVYWKKSNKKWFAYINAGKEREWLGSFDTEEEAVIARKEAEAKYFVYMI